MDCPNEQPFVPKAKGHQQIIDHYCSVGDSTTWHSIALNPFFKWKCYLLQIRAKKLFPVRL